MTRNVIALWTAGCGVLAMLGGAQAAPPPTVGSAPPTTLRPATTTTAATRTPIPPDHLIPKARAKRFQIDYQVNPEALPLTRVELWYTLDRGQTWYRYGQDPDSQTPLEFVAPAEGLTGLFFVLSNGTGSSGPPPHAGSVPQQWLWVDYTPPIVQLHPVVVGWSGATAPVLHIRWTAIDTQFPPRPITLAYRRPPDGVWENINTRLSNTGRFDWHPPENLEGRIVLRLTALDRGGHQVSAVTKAVDLARPADFALLDGAEKTPTLTTAATQPAVSAEAQRRIDALCRQGQVFQERGEHRRAAGCFQDALVLNPRMPDTLESLGESLYLQGRYADAERAYRWALQLEPTWAAPRRALARTLKLEGRYQEASAEWTRLVRQEPTDADAWLALGDLAVALGDQLVAREHWHKAATVDPQMEDVIEKAQARLADLRRMTGRATRN